MFTWANRFPNFSLKIKWLMPFRFRKYGLAFEVLQLS